MANEEQHYSADFKIRVAKEAIEQDKKNLDRLSDKYEVPVSSILTWCAQLEKHGEEFFRTEQKQEADETEEQFSEEGEVGIEVADDELVESIEYGVMHDNLNYNRLIFWSVLGAVLVVLFVFALGEMFEYNRLVFEEQAAESTEFYDVNVQQRKATETLNSFGIVDLENKIYRIPIDSAINEMAENQ